PPRSDCLSQRRLVFSRLFSGPAPPPSMRPPPPPCLLLPPLQTGDEDPSSLLSLMGEVLQGVFPSVGEALSALSLSSPPRLQETLFGGRFLQNISGGVGVGGVVVGEGLSPDSGGRVQTVIRALKDPNFLSNLQEVLRSSSQSEASLQQVFHVIVYLLQVFHVIVYLFHVIVYLLQVFHVIVYLLQVFHVFHVIVYLLQVFHVIVYLFHVIVYLLQVFHVIVYLLQVLHVIVYLLQVFHVFHVIVYLLQVFHVIVYLLQVFHVIVYLFHVIVYLLQVFHVIVYLLQVFHVFHVIVYLLQVFPVIVYLLQVFHVIVYLLQVLHVIVYLLQVFHVFHVIVYLLQVFHVIVYLLQVLSPVLRSCSRGSSALFVPRCSPGGDFLPLQCGGGRTISAGPAGGAVTCPERATQEPPSSEGRSCYPVKTLIRSLFADDRPVSWCGENETLSKQKTKHLMKDFPNLLPGAHRALIGRCSRALDDVTVFRQEVQSIINLSNSSHLPLGYGFLLAHGLQLTPEELQTGQSEKELLVSERLLSRSDAALRLAAFSKKQEVCRCVSALQMLLPPLRRSYQLFSPQCDSDGDWLHTQCHHSTGQCWCVDEDGEYIADSLTSRSLHLPKCLTRCQRAQAHSLLSGWMKGSSTSAYQPTCEEDGGFSVLQKGGADGWCVNPRTGDTLQTATQSATGQLTCPSWCELQGSQCRPDGSFIPLQCDVTSCWCVSEDGQEVGGTRTSRQTRRTPSCDRPLCPNSITHGALLCRPAAEGQQSCDLVCHRGYHNSLPVGSFLCDSEGQRWTGDPPLSGACQIPQPLLSVSSSQLWLLSSSCTQISRLKPLLFTMMTSRGLCSAQLPVSSVSLCDGSSVHLQCVGDDAMKLTFRWSSALTDLPTSDLPDLHHAGLFLNESRLLEGVQGLLGNIRSMFTSEPKLVSMTTPNYGCSHGYRLANDGEGCVVCPAGSLSSEGACLQCPQGTYQDEEGRDFCNKCPRGSSLSGASSVSQCVTECQRRGLRCSDRGDFLSAQPDFLSGRWRCVSSEGAELQWTNREEPLTDNQCSDLLRFQTVSGSDLIVGAEDAEVLKTMTSDLTSCVQACAAEPTCHHVALFNTQTQCELYSTHTLNTHCNTSAQTQGFLGNPEAELFDWLSCSLRVRGGASDLLVVRKKEFSPLRYERVRMRKALSGVFRTQVFRRTSLSDALLFCSDGCSADACCHGFTLNLNTLQGGTLPRRHGGTRGTRE
ncbi:hypothetical protein NQZ68_031963, partial [Dissostichus eleginoides]